MADHIIPYSLPEGDRAFKRKALISLFLEEEAGSGCGENASRYQYEVEAYEAYGIYLKRPTQLNKGFDFTVNIRGLFFKKNRRYSNPGHQDIISALEQCKLQLPAHEYKKISDTITELYQCREPSSFCEITAQFQDYAGQSHPIQIILLAIKWLFMEQDCAYWNYSGRNMLYQKLLEIGLIS